MNESIKNTASPIHPGSTLASYKRRLQNDAASLSNIELLEEAYRADGVRGTWDCEANEYERRCKAAQIERDVYRDELARRLKEIGFIPPN